MSLPAADLIWLYDMALFPSARTTSILLILEVLVGHRELHFYIRAIVSSSANLKKVFVDFSMK